MKVGEEYNNILKKVWLTQQGCLWLLLCLKKYLPTWVEIKNQECCLDKSHASQEYIYLLVLSLVERNLNLNPRVDSKLRYYKNLKGNNREDIYKEFQMTHCMTEPGKQILLHDRLVICSASFYLCTYVFCFTEVYKGNCIFRDMMQTQNWNKGLLVQCSLQMSSRNTSFCDRS